MMRKLIIFLMACFVVLSARPVNAQIISFDDNAFFWPGWNNATPDDTKDSIGIPNFTKVTGDVEGGRLISLTVDRQSSSSSALWGVLSPGDLFIDLGADETWDYVVDLTNWAAARADNTDPVSGQYSIYSINLGLNSTTGYILSGTDYTNGWSGYAIRDRHPVATNLTLQNGSLIDFSGWGDVTTKPYIFNFEDLNGGGLGLGTSGKFTIGWGTNCANDEIYGTLNYDVVPEPGSIALMGIGLLGLARRLRKKS